MEYTNEYVLDKIKRDRSVGANPIDKLPEFKKPWEGYIDNTKYDVDATAVYDFDRNGKAELKFKNYLGETNNEDRLAKQQSGWEQVGNGLAKNLMKTFLYAGDGINTVTYGLYSAIKDGQIQSLWNNDVSNYLDDQAKKLDRNFANYYTNEEKSKGFLGRLWENPANFLANDVAGGLAFVGGAILPELALGVLTGGASVTPSMAKFGAKLGLKKAFGLADNIAEGVVKEGIEEGISKTAKEIASQEFKTGFRNLLRNSNIGNTVGQGLNTARFIGQSTFFEAGMEARQNFKNSIDNYMTKYQEREGQLPSQDELGNFIKEAGNSADWVFRANVGLLSITNAAMFGKFFKLPEMHLETKVGKLFGIDIAKLPTGNFAMKEATKAQKVLGKTYFLTKKPFSEGVVEEGMQGVFGHTMDNYLQSKYNPEQPDMTLMQSFGEALQEQYTTKEGWFEIGIGALIGSIGGNISGDFGIEGFGKKGYIGAVKDLEGKVDTYNTEVAKILHGNDSTTNSFKGLIRANSVMNYQANREAGIDATPAFQDTLVNFNYIKANEALKGYTDTIADFDTAVDSMVLTNDQMKSFGFKEQAEVDEYKNSLKENFKKDYDTYNEVDAIVNNLQVPDFKEGDLAEFREAVTFSLMAGKKAGTEAERIANNLSKITGDEGIYDALKFAQEMDEQKIENVQLLKEKEARLEELNNEILDIGQRLEGSSDNQAQYKEYSKKHMLVAEEIKKVTEEKATLESAMQKDFEAIRANLTFAPKQLTATSIRDIVQKLDSLSEYTDSLRKMGRTKEAENIETLLEQFKLYSSAEINSATTVRRMASTNFYSTSEGKGLLSKIRGNDYAMSEEARKDIRDGEALVRDVLVKNGFEYSNVDEVIENSLKNNPKLSEREKYKMESMLRATLAYKRIQTLVGEASKEQERAEKTAVSMEFAQEGDTIFMSENLQGRDLTNPETINQLIKDITNQIDLIVNQPTAESLREIKIKEKEIEQLKNQLKQIQDADAKQKSESLPMGNQSQTSGEVREGNAQGQTTTQESNQEETITQLEADIQRIRLQLGHENNKKMFDEFINLIQESLNRIGFNGLTTQELEILLKGLDDNSVAIVGGVSSSARNNVEREDLDTAWIEEPANLTPAEAYEYEKALIKLKEYLSSMSARQQPQSTDKIEKDRFTTGGSEPIFIGSIIKTLVNNRYAELKALEETISDEDYKNFVDNGVVSQEIIDNIANKVKDRVPLSERENAIYIDKTVEINDSLLKLVNEIESLSEDEVNEVINQVEQEDDSIKTMDDFETFRDAVAYNVVRTSNIALDESEANYGEAKSIEEVQQLLDKGGINIEKVDSSEMSDGNYASYDGDKIKVTDENIPLQILLHEIGEKVINDLDKAKVKIVHSNSIFEAVTTYGASRGNDAFADNFYLYFLSPSTLKDLSPDVFNELDKLIPDNVKELGINLMSIYNVTPQTLKYNKPKTQGYATTRENVTNIGGETKSDPNRKNTEDEPGQTVQATQTVNPKSDVENQIQQIAESIQKLEDEINELRTPFKFMDSEGYIRYNELLQKKIKDGELSEQEQAEMDNLKASINQWITITGVRVQGIELTDLIRQMQALEATRPEKEVETVEVTEEEIDNDVIITEDAVKNNYQVGLSYGAVVSRRVKDGTIISNITPEQLEKVSEVSLNGIERTETGGIKLTNELVDEINSQGKVVVINPAFDESTSVHPTVLQSIPNPITGQEDFIPLESNFDVEVDKNGKPLVDENGDPILYQNGIISPETIYNVSEGDGVLIKIDPNHPYNKELLNRLREAMGITKPLTEEERRVEVEKIVQAKSLKSKLIEKSQAEIAELQSKEQLTTSQKAKLNQLTKRLNEQIQEIRVKAEEEVDNRKEKAPKKPSQELVDEIIRDFRLMVVTADEAFNLQILKKIRTSDGYEGTNPHFEALRVQLLSDPQKLLDIIETNNEQNSDLGIKITKIFMGNPNYNYTRNAEGRLVRQNKPIVKEDLDKIEEIGYVENGELKLRGGRTRKGINQDFINSAKKKNSKAKIPVIIVKRGKQLIAYPVKVGRDSSPIDLDAFKSIFESDSITAVDKAIRLNTMLAEAGIDIKQKGNAFVVIGDNTLNKDFFDNIFAQLEQKEYIRSVSSWSDSKQSIEDALLNNATININMSNPFISPKIKFDFSAIEVQEIPETKKKSTKKAVVTHKESELKNFRCKK